MKKPPPVALVCAGNLTDSALTRFRGLAARLGPVKSTSLRLASRFANILRAGHAVADYDLFRECPLLLVAVPDEVAATTIRELSHAGLDWTHESVVLCSTVLESEELSPLAELGAGTASICEATAFDGRLFVAEGDREAIKQVRPLVEGPSRTGAARVLSLPRGHKAFYLAALACTGPLFTSLLSCAGECLKLAGVAASDADSMLQTQAEKTTRSFLKGGRKLSPESADLDRQIEALRSRNPELAEFFQQSAKLTRWVSKQA
jgi:predicted short-subunit dehydrogenase-like oxidoreductase (DUF2520 family)